LESQQEISVRDIGKSIRRKKNEKNKFDRLCQQHNRAAKKQGAEKIKNYFWTQHTQNTLDMHAIIVLDDQVTKMQFQKNKFLFFKKEREMILLFFTNQQLLQAGLLLLLRIVYVCQYPQSE
jgi:hypothetical protein